MRLLESRVKNAFVAYVGDSADVADAEVVVVFRPDLRESTARKQTARYEPQKKVTSTKRTTSPKKSGNKVSMAESDQDGDFEVVPLSPEKEPEGKRWG